MSGTRTPSATITWSGWSRMENSTASPPELKLHQFHARSVRRIQVQLPFAIAPNLRRRMPGGEPVSFVQQVHGLLQILYTQREVVEHARGFLASVGGMPVFRGPFTVMYSIQSVPSGTCWEIQSVAPSFMPPCQ